MKQSSSVRLALLGGLLLVAVAGCSDQTSAPATEIPPNVADIEPIRSVTQRETYIVQPGDILREIAARRGVTLTELAAHNGIVDMARIDVGQVLEIPGTGIVGTDDFMAVPPAERYEDLYPLPRLASPPPPTLTDRFIERINALPWPERDDALAGGTIVGFLVTSFVAWSLLAKTTDVGRRWGARALPSGGRTILRAWRAGARQSRHIYDFVAPRCLTIWQVSARQIDRTHHSLVPRGLALWRVAARQRRPIYSFLARHALTTAGVIMRAMPVIGRRFATSCSWTRSATMSTGDVLRSWVGRTLDMARDRSQKTNQLNQVPQHQRASTSRWLPGRKVDTGERPKWRSENTAELAAAFERQFSSKPDSAR